MSGVCVYEHACGKQFNLSVSPQVPSPLFYLTRSFNSLELTKQAKLAG